MQPMPPATGSLRHALSWAQLAPSIRAGLWVVALFALGVAAARRFEPQLGALLAAHAALGIAVFFVSSIVAVLMPVLSNLPLVPIAVLAWGPWWTAALLLAGWIAGATLSFTLGRHARGAILRRFPSVQRHAEVDRLIHPRHRLASLILLRMTFPVDVLSYALGLFSRATKARDVALSTLLGAAPFALLFAWFPVLPIAAQALVLGGSAAAFFVYVLWVLGEPSKDRSDAR
jgi:uncharacterized membrane protein YdjX (TVP38/TMEM64 family)